MPKRDRLGPTGKFPQGKLNANDEGELAFQIGSLEGNVILEFGGPVHWVGLPPKLAREMAAMLVKHADYIEHREN